MKSIVGIFPVLFLIAGSAFGCPNFSGKYVEAGTADSFTIVQAGCDSWTWLAEGSAPSTTKIDGKTYVYQDDGANVITEKASWDGSKLVEAVEMRMKNSQSPQDLLMSITDEYSLNAQGDIILVETQLDPLFGDTQPLTTTHTYNRVP